MPYQKYVETLHQNCDEVYEIAEEARSKGHDPKNHVEIPQAHDLADRTQKLLKFLHPRNTAQQIRELTKIHDGNRELVALDIGKIVAAETYINGISKVCKPCSGRGYTKEGWKENECDSCGGVGFDFEYTEMPSWEQTLHDFNQIKEFDNREKIPLSIYHGVCAGLAVLTEGILVAPLEGVVSAKLLENKCGTECISINYAGPIRSAGGTGQALSVLIGDILRRMFKISSPEITNREIERYKEEVQIYARGLQYRPSNPQLEIIAKNCPVYLDGEGVGNEVSGQRDLPRVTTNKVREGAVLVMCEGLVLKAPKILKYVNELELDGWEWLNEFIIKDTNDDEGVKPCYKYLGDVLAGRPIFSQPMREGGFRLRYGRSRLAGLATTSLHPATMKALGGFIITGTQMKYERPGKATVATPCTTIDGPYVQFKDGSAKRLISEDELEEGLPIDLDWPIEKIWDLGEILVPVGEFLENNHKILPSPYVREWHEQVLGGNYPENFIEALEQSTLQGIPMAPEYVAHFSNISALELMDFCKSLNVSVCGGFVEVPVKYLNIAYRLNIDVELYKGEYYLVGDASCVLINNIPRIKSAIRINMDIYDSSLEWLNELADYEIRPRVTYRIGARMGKPEGAKLREMKPSIHVLYPLGHDVGSQRKVIDAIKKETKIEIGFRYCEMCDGETVKGVCCGEDTKFIETRYLKNNASKDWNEAKMMAGLYANLPVKGVKGMPNMEKCPEHLVKGLMRYNNDISVFRDGTIRFDMVDISMTHFRPKEIGLSKERAIQLGYDVKSDDEVVELFPQDIVISKDCAEIFLRTMNYIDDLLENLYGMERFYNCKTISDMFGHLCMGLAPHTSGAILCRLIGVAEIKGHYGHPFFHAGKRRNCDGDIDSVLLLLDGLINFSRSFLSKHRGGQMDAPLILTTKLNPSEIDKEALNVDIGWNYPIEFYTLSQSLPSPKEVLGVGVKIVESVLGTDEEVRGFGFTHDTEDCSQGPKNNPYNTLDSMRQKTMVQFALGETLHCVDNEDQASRLINRHLIRDMRGNLRAFGQQKVRCTKCGQSYRRPPITGKCNTIVETKVDPFTGEPIKVICPGNVILTVTKGSVGKYDGLMAELIEKYGCNEYTEELYTLVSKWVSETFRNENDKEQLTLW